MKRSLAVAICSLGAVALLLVTTKTRAQKIAVLTDRPQYANGKLIRPSGYREWIYVSSGLGMSYSASSNPNPQFTNLFVPQWAYKQFVASGQWPEKTIFVLEERSSETKGSINKGGRFQTDLSGLAVEVKDDQRFSDNWAYFNFPGDAQEATANPRQACWQCHDTNAAVEHTFVQFYPTLKPVAQKFGTYQEPSSEATPH
ncbi:MAG TPA: cytochrome P460 family protein [Candidatus Acidoferrales bacterium]|nr:cytochrome P460 family protein [Candidatus Acidoferrales bacterium]